MQCWRIDGDSMHTFSHLKASPPSSFSALAVCTVRSTVGLTMASIVCGLALTSFVQAQTLPAIEFYGLVDVGVTRSNDGKTSTISRPVPSSAWVVKAGNTSRLGVRGKEDLGDGSYARFQLEHRFAIDTGASSNANTFWLGRSVGAVGNASWGEIYGGREYSAAYWVALNADPTSWSYVSQTGTPYTYANYTAVAATIEATNNRWSNSLGYKTPTWNGLSGEVAMAPGEGPRKRNTSSNVQYKNGPVWVGLGVDRLDKKNNLNVLAGGYDFGVVYPTLSYSQAKGGLSGDAKSYTVSVRVPVNYGRVYASYGALQPDKPQQDSTMVGLGSEYTLSKRTLAYANVGSAKREALTRTTAIDFGVKHTF